MRNNSSKLIAGLGLTLSSVILAVSSVGGSTPAFAEFRAPQVRVPVRVGVHNISPAIIGGGVYGAPGAAAAAAAAGAHRGFGRPIGRHIGINSCEGGGSRYRFNHCDVDVSTPPVLGTGGTNGANNGTNNTAFNPRGGLPAPGERRFVPDEIITEFSANTSPQTIRRLAGRLDLTQLETQSFPLIGATLYRWRVGGGRSALSAVGALANQDAVSSVQPNYVFSLQQDAAQTTGGTQGDPAQYVLSKLQVDQAHQIATGKDVPVAVIDSEIDVAHPDINGTTVKSFDALGGDGKPQQHGTAMAGAIISHGKLEGIAPGAELLAARAFDDQSNGTSFAIYKSVQWAADNGARIINMSFAGPPDPTMHRMLVAAYGKGIVLVAAAGNGGPKAAPLYPGADPDVIAVTATDDNDGLLDSANRGQYIAVAAPGVQILSLAPADSYTINTGTSVAAAHVSGVAALLLQHEPDLKPGDIRSILTTTAKPLSVPEGQTDFGAGLVNAYRAVTSPEEKSAGNHGDHEQVNR
jgi:subtilisin family serine protease